MNREVHVRILLLIERCATGNPSNDVTNEDDIYIGTRTIGVNANFYFK